MFFLVSIIKTAGIWAIKRVVKKSSPDITKIILDFCINELKGQVERTPNKWDNKLLEILLKVFNA